MTAVLTALAFTIPAVTSRSARAAAINSSHVAASCRPRNRRRSPLGCASFRDCTSTLLPYDPGVSRDREISERLWFLCDTAIEGEPEK
jgi:hypothetical protein